MILIYIIYILHLLYILLQLLLISPNSRQTICLLETKCCKRTIRYDALEYDAQLRTE